MANKNIDWKEIYEDYKNSGLSVLKYSQEHEIKAFQLGYYKRKFENKTTNSLFEVNLEEKRELPISNENKDQIDNNNVIKTVDESLSLEIKIKEITISIKNASELSKIVKSILNL